MSLHVRSDWRVTVSAVIALLAVAGCDEAQLPGGAGPASQSGAQGVPTSTVQSAPTGASSAQPSASASGSNGQVSAVFEVTGSGKASSLHVDDGTPMGLDLYNVPLPFRKEARVDAGVGLLQVHAAGASGQVSCQITLGGKVVVASPDTGDCVYNRPGQN